MPQSGQPDHLPRETVMHEPEQLCGCCEPGKLARLGEDVTEVLEKIPARLKVIRYVRPRYACRVCEAVFQAPAPDLPIERGRPGPGLIAHVAVSKYCDGLPLFRQSVILAREGVEIDRVTLADWIGRAAWWLAPLARLIGTTVMAQPVLHTDDTPIRTLAPGTGKTKLARFWVYAVDPRSHAGPAPPAAFYRYSADRKGERPREHLSGFSGVMHADAFAGYDALYRAAPGQPAREQAGVAHRQAHGLGFRRPVQRAAQQALVARHQGRELRAARPHRRHVIEFVDAPSLGGVARLAGGKLHAQPFVTRGHARGFGSAAAQHLLQHHSTVDFAHADSQLLCQGRLVVRDLHALRLQQRGEREFARAVHPGGDVGVKTAFAQALEGAQQVGLSHGAAFTALPEFAHDRVERGVTFGPQGEVQAQRHQRALGVVAHGGVGGVFVLAVVLDPGVKARLRDALHMATRGLLHLRDGLAQ